MKRPWIGLAISAGIAGCVPTGSTVRQQARSIDPAVTLTAQEKPMEARTEASPSPLPAALPSGPFSPPPSDAAPTSTPAPAAPTPPPQPTPTPPNHQHNPPGREPLIGPQAPEACVRRALEENRGVRAAWWRVQAKQARIPQEGALSDPQFTNEVFPIPSNGPQTASGYMPWSFSVMQQFPWFGVRPLRAAVAEREMFAAIQQWNQAQLDVTAQTRQMYAEMARAKQSLRVLGEIEKKLGEYVELARIRFETRTGREPGLQRAYFQAQQEVEDIKREEAQLRNEFYRARADLNRWLHQPSEMEVEPLAGISIAPPAERLENLRSQALNLRPDLRATMAEIDRNHLLTHLAELKAKPEITLGLIYQSMSKTNAISPVADGNDNIGFVAGWSLPIYRSKIQGGIDEARAQTIAESLRLEDQQDQALAEVAGRYSQARTSGAIRDLLRDRVLPKAVSAREASENDYRAGNGDLFVLNSVTRDVLRTKLEIIRQEAELAKAMASLEQAVGGPLSVSSVETNKNETKETDEIDLGETSQER